MSAFDGKPAAVDKALPATDRTGHFDRGKSGFALTGAAQSNRMGEPRGDRAMNYERFC
jgi:hypothetical protein